MTLRQHMAESNALYGVQRFIEEKLRNLLKSHFFVLDVEQFKFLKSVAVLKIIEVRVRGRGRYGTGRNVAIQA